MPPVASKSAMIFFSTDLAEPDGLKLLSVEFLMPSPWPTKRVLLRPDSAPDAFFWLRNTAALR